MAGTPSTYSGVDRRPDLERAENEINGPTTDKPPSKSSTSDAVENDFITQNAACRMTALSKGYISKLCSGGEIRTNGIQGRGLRLSAASLARFMESKDTNQ